MARAHQAVFDRILRTALRYPGTYPESPWGDLVVKVNKKIFVFLGANEQSMSLSVKLPMSQVEALEHPWAAPARYGMGKHGWVSCRFDRATAPPFELIVAWLDESFRAVAPKRVVKALPPEGIGAAPVDPEPTPPEPQVDDDDLAVLLVGNDPLRLDRARMALAHMGHASVAVEVGDEALDVAGSAEPRLVILDLSRNAQEALALGPQLELLCPDGRLAIAGVRDSKQQRKVQAAVSSGTLLSREAPGDPKFLGQITALI